MPRHWLIALCTGAGLTLQAGQTAAQTAPVVPPAPTTTPTAAPFQPIPPQQEALYRFNLARNFFPNEAALTKAIQQAEAQVKDLETLKGKVLDSPQNLYQALKGSDDFIVTFSRVYWYLDLKYSTNTKDTASRNRAADLDARLGPRLSFINDEIQKITPAQLQRFLAREPRLKPYEWVIRESLRSKPHTLSLKEEELLARTSPLMTRWQGDQFDLLMDRAKWGKVKDPTGEEMDVRQDEGRISNSADREVRREGFEKTNAAYKDQRDLFAFIVTNVAKTRNDLAKIRGFINGQDAAYFGLHLSYADVENAYGQIQANGSLNKRFQTLRRDRIGAFTGFEKVHVYDLTVVPPGVEKPRFTIDQARQVILASTKYLGPEYNKELTSLLDPKQGRLDLVAGSNRVPGAFAIPSPGMPSVFYSYAYEGYLGDVGTLAHEAGHVVQSALQNNAKVPPAVSDGPRYFTESYAILNELVLLDNLYRQARDPGLKTYYLEQLLQNMMGFYGNTRIAQIEKSLYETVDKGTVKNAGDLDAITLKIGSRTSIWYDIDPEIKNLWQQVPHYYSSPTYYVNYVFADLLAQTYFAMYKQDPEAFAKKFVPLLRNGFNDSPHTLLKQFLGINLRDPKTFQGVFQQQERYLKELEALYAAK